MAVRFKFRSSANFDSVDIEGRPSISVRDLKQRIIRNKNLSICQDFDLVLSDAVSAQEYPDDNFQIPSGSSVIIKRVPAGSAHFDSMPCVANVGIREANAVKTPPLANVEIDDFDDFGEELCPVPDFDWNKEEYVTDKKENIEVPRCLKSSLGDCQKPETSDISEAIPRGVENVTNSNLSPGVKEYTELEKVVTANPLAMQRNSHMQLSMTLPDDLPAELKCSLCDTLFKDALMIPCCQHSFCEKCIDQVLAENGRCPRCSSTKCKVEDLLPNVSLRQAIERFLKSQILMKGSENTLRQYVPDGESGIHANELSCAMSVHLREPDLPHSPSTTGRGSNHIIVDSISGRAASISRKLKPLDGIDIRKESDNLVADYQGENHPMQEEAESIIKKKRALWVNNAGVDRSFLEMGRHRKGDRTCYMCGSPDHFIRDCPVASSPHPMLQTDNTMFLGAMPAYLSPYWNGSSFPQVRPFINPYGNPGMMPFNATMVPTTTFAVPTYMPSMFGGMSTYGGFTRMGGGAAPLGTNSERQQDHLVQGSEKMQKLSKENLKRGQSFNDDEEDSFNWRCHANEAESFRDIKHHRDKEESVSYSKDSFGKRCLGKHLRHNYFDDEQRSSSEVEDMPSSSSWHGVELRKHHHSNSKKYGGREENHDGDSSHGRRHSNIEKDGRRRRLLSDNKRDKHKHHSQLESSIKLHLSGDQKMQQKERGSNYGRRHSRLNSKSMDDELSHERWQMVIRSDEIGEDCHFHKQKRKRVY